ncbi:hypothetical protein ACS0TY_014644 [Phlomoides rotata]
MIRKDMKTKMCAKKRSRKRKHLPISLVKLKKQKIDNVKKSEDVVVASVSTKGICMSSLHL